MEKINEGVFKAYDIRGIYPTEIDEHFAYALGRGYATLVLEKNPAASTVVLSSDMRLSSPSLKAAVLRGLIESGLHVVDIGISSTPTFYFAVAYYGYDAGIQVSASHNPKDYNGFKMVMKKSFPVSKNSGIMRLKEIMLAEAFVSNSGPQGVVYEEKNVLEDMGQEQLAKIDPAKIKHFKIVIDASNAMGALDMEEFFKHIPAEIIPLNFELDGSFPSHEADPMKEENVKLLREEVVRNGADFGIAIDGDADRYFFVDEKGEGLPQEILRGIMAQIELRKTPGAVICYDIRPGRITRDMIEAMQGDPIVTPVGHSLIKEIMIENGAIFGGESSGHYFYKEDYGTFEMPFIFLSNFLLFLSAQDKPFSEVMKPYRKYFHSGEINRKVQDPQAVLQRIKEKYADGKQLELDGITVEYPEWWFNVRASNTEPLVRLNLESVSAELTAAKVQEVLAVIEA
jgi:phosphomannomutase